MDPPQKVKPEFLGERSKLPREYEVDFLNLPVTLFAQTTQTRITARINLFESVVNTHSKKIHQHGNASWDPINETTKTQTVRQFLIKRKAGLDYLNRTVAPLISKDGRVVKFAGLFLHGTAMVRGWTVNPKTGHKTFNRDCELADLMSVFLYLDSGNTIRRVRCVLFQAKMTAAAGAHVIDDLKGGESLKETREHTSQAIGNRYAAIDASHWPGWG